MVSWNYSDCVLISKVFIFIFVRSMHFIPVCCNEACTEVHKLQCIWTCSTSYVVSKRHKKERVSVHIHISERYSVTHVIRGNSTLKSAERPLYVEIRVILLGLDQSFCRLVWKSRCLGRDESITLHNDFTMVCQMNVKNTMYVFCLWK